MEPQTDLSAHIGDGCTVAPNYNHWMTRSPPLALRLRLGPHVGSGTDRNNGDVSAVWADRMAPPFDPESGRRVKPLNAGRGTEISSKSRSDFFFLFVACAPNKTSTASVKDGGGRRLTEEGGGGRRREEEGGGGRRRAEEGGGGSLTKRSRPSDAAPLLMVA